MMKFIISAVVCLAATAFVVDGSVCNVQCTETSGSWSGNSSVVVKVGTRTDIIYDVRYKIFAVVSYQERREILWATNGKFLLIMSKTGGCILIDLKTSYAVYWKIAVSSFKNSDGSMNYTELIDIVNDLCIKFESITISTSSSFNFNLIIEGYYSGQFDLSIIFSGQTELVAELNESFSAWFEILQVQISNGSIRINKGVWGFLVVAFDVEMDIGFAIIEVVRTSVVYYKSVRALFIIEIVKRIRTNIRSIVDFSLKLKDCIATSINTSIEHIVGWINNPSTNPRIITLTLAGTTYTFSVTKIQSEYVIRFTFLSSTMRDIDMKIVFTRNVLFFINLESNIAIAFHKKAFIIVNMTSDLFLFGSISFVSLQGSVFINAELGKYIREERYSAAAGIIIRIVEKYHSHHSFSFEKLRIAIISNSASKVTACVGSKYSSTSIIKLFGGFFEHTRSSSVSGIFVGIFENSKSAVATTFGGTIGLIARSSGDWSAFIKVFGKIQVSS